MLSAGPRVRVSLITRAVQVSHSPSSTDPKTHFVLSAGIEPASLPSEGSVLSIERRKHTFDVLLAGIEAYSFSTPIGFSVRADAPENTQSGFNSCAPCSQHDSRAQMKNPERNFHLCSWQESNLHFFLRREVSYPLNDKSVSVINSGF